jgi:hypothetical protein
MIEVSLFIVLDDELPAVPAGELMVRRSLSVLVSAWLPTGNAQKIALFRRKYGGNNQWVMA